MILETVSHEPCLPDEVCILPDTYIGYMMYDFVELLATGKNKAGEYVLKMHLEDDDQDESRCWYVYLPLSVAQYKDLHLRNVSVRQLLLYADRVYVCQENFCQNIKQAFSLTALFPAEYLPEEDLFLN